MTTISIKEYRASDGAPFTNKDAATFGPELERIEMHYGAPLAPDVIVEEARRPKSPLHPYFDWNNDAAADKWRRFQARNLLNHLEVRVEQSAESGGTEAEWVKGWHSVHRVEYTPSTQPVTERGYASMQIVIQTPDYMAQVSAEARRMLGVWRQRYEQYQRMPEFSAEFQPVFAAVAALEQKS